MRYTGPRNKISRREGMDLGLKTPGAKAHSSLLRRINLLPGQHGLKKRKKISERGEQLREKQKLRYIFGITEKQLKKYFKIASEKKGNTASYLAIFLERRLDNIVYRLGFTPTRASARQLVSHGHIKVNDKIINIPSYQVKINDIISLFKEKTQKIPYIQKQLSIKEIILPFWLEKEAMVGKLISQPDSSEIEKQINLRLVIEYYSR
ncbi:MAG: 30S ribosomal protein S4 [Patescibacteria group bacterium]|nr:30S ribosomal protein S4 [Patescibacteria group bacterium]